MILHVELIIDFLGLMLRRKIWIQRVILMAEFVLLEIC